MSLAVELVPVPMPVLALVQERAFAQRLGLLAMSLETSLQSVPALLRPPWPARGAPARPSWATGQQVVGPQSRVVGP